jgi:hypothetical protein
MVAVFVFTNPFLFWASERKLALRTQINLHRHIAGGFTILYHNSPLVWFSVVAENYSTLPFLALTFVAAIIASIKSERRLLNGLILAWVIPFSLYIAFVLVIRPKHFPLPILLPLYSAVPAYFTFFAPPRWMGPLGDYLKKYGLRLLMFVTGLLVVAGQFVFSLNMDIAQYVDTLNREKNNPSLNFYSALDQNDLSRLKLGRQLVVFRDVVMYVPNSANDKVYYQWGVSGYADIHKFKADLLLLSKQHLYDYTQPGQTAVDPNFSDAVHFYKDALAGQVQGYTLIYQDAFGMAYLSTPLADEFLSTH